MTRTRIENFSAKVIERLRNRVGLRCSNPDCRRPTAAPGPGEIGVTLVGEAAHIHAASAGGPRYLATMGTEERRSIDNALWLCSICHIKVDRNPHQFDAALLKDWKRRAELSATAELGQQLPTAADAQRLLMAALDASPRHLPLNAIANVVGATEAYLRAMDPRFAVRASYTNGAPHYTIEALEPVQLSFKANNLDAEALAGLRAMFDHGTPVTMQASQVTIDGSQLMAHIVDLAVAEKASLTISTREVSAVLKLKLCEPASNQIVAFDDMPGAIKVGRRSIEFEGRNCGGILQISFRKLFDETPLTDGQFWADLASWDGRDVRRLPYHDTLATLFSKLASGWNLEFALEVEGRVILQGSFNSDDRQQGYFGTMNTLLGYSIRARSVANFMNERVLFRSSVSFTKEENRALADAVEVFELKCVHGREEQVSNVRCRLMASDDQIIERLQGSRAPLEVMICAEEREPIKIFDQIVILPPVEVVLNAVVAKVLANRKRSNGERRDLQVEFEPSDGYQCMVRYGSLPNPVATVS